MSARDLYEKNSSSKPIIIAIFELGMKQWKVKAFEEIAKRHNPSMLTNIVVLGDSTYEIEAGHHMKR